MKMSLKLNTAAKNIYQELTKSTLKGFINLDKFLDSELFLVTFNSYIEHMHRCGNCNGVLNFINVFESSKKYKPLILWICDSEGFEFFIEDDEIKLRKYKKKVRADCIESISTYLADKSKRGTFREILIKSKQTNKVSWTKDNYIDQMDRKVPGSFGSGKRK